MPNDQGGDVFSELFGQTGVVSLEHLGHTRDLRGRSRSGCGGVLAGHQHMHIAATLAARR